MKCEKIKELIPDYLLGNLDPENRSHIEEHISECTGCKEEIENVTLVWSKLEQIPREEPGLEVRKRFYSMLEAYRYGMDVARTRQSWSVRLNKWLEKWWPRQPVFQFAITVVFLICGLVIGQKVHFGTSSNGELVQLREEIQEMRQLVTISLVTRPSAVERLQGVSMSRFVDDPDDRVLNGLLRTVNSDPNVNVRLAAVDALYKFSDRPRVRTELVTSLSNQTSPLVQISLIDLLVEKQEQSALEVLKKLADDQQVIEPVKKRARQGIQNII